MLPLFTQLLKDYLEARNVAPGGRISLGPPDRLFVQALPAGQSVNVYLADIRENRKLRTNDRRREEVRQGAAREHLHPSWVDAHYLITAWDTSANQSSRSLREQQVLTDISAALLAGDPFTPSEVYRNPIDVRLNAWPEEFRLPGLPYQVLPPEGFPKLSEFWTTMGAGSLWKPAVYLVASVPVDTQTTFEAPIVTTISTSSGQTASAPGRQLIRERDEDGYRSGTVRNWRQIGGTVYGRGFGPDPTKFALPGVRVLLESADLSADAPAYVRLQDTRTDGEGRYRFTFVSPVEHRLIGYRVVVQPYRFRPRKPFVVDLFPESPHYEVNLSLEDPYPHDVIMRPL